MASDFTIRAINNWRAEVHTSMATAALVSMEVWHREGTEATRILLAYMAQSARAMTKQSPEYRPVKTDEHGEYVERHHHGQVAKIYKWMYSEAHMAKERARLMASHVYGLRRRAHRLGTWEGAQTISNRGMAKRSWMWGFGKDHPMKMVTVVDRVTSGGRSVGYQLTNRLGYIDKIMPAGYQAAAEQKAVNKLMKQAEMKMVRAYEREVGRRAA
jgi:hypothetical protein